MFHRRHFRQPFGNSTNTQKGKVIDRAYRQQGPCLGPTTPDEEAARAELLVNSTSLEFPQDFTAGRVLSYNVTALVCRGKEAVGWELTELS